jgi:ABC-2 type transport system ATP-binding protein
MRKLVEVKGVCKSYGNYSALTNVNIEVDQGKIFGLLGPNGAGKTSLIRILNQITAPDSGEVFFEGRRLELEDVANVGYLPEERGLYKKMKIGEQCLYLAQLKGMSNQSAKKALMLWFEKFEIQNWWNKTVEDLSKGMAQKVQFITTVIHQPKLLILDEPFSGFDPINAALIQAEMLELKRNGVTIILSTHDMGSVEELCDDIALINQSQVILKGSVSEIKQQFRSQTFLLQYKGTAFELGIQLGHRFELISHEVGIEFNTAIIKIIGDSSLNDLLQLVIGFGQIVGVHEVIPNMSEIFIRAVTQTSQNRGI